MTQPNKLTTAVPDVTITENGLLVPNAAEVLSGRLTDMVQALGGNASTSLSSPQGQIAQSDTEIILQVYDKLLCLFNQINPDFASGRFQDSIGRIYFMDRLPGRGTTVTADLIGKVGTVVPAGSVAQDAAGYQYKTTDDVTIPDTGTVQAVFSCTTPGAIECPVGSLNQIYKAVNGWDSVYNNTPGVLGSVVESRTAFEKRRRASVARNSRNQDASTHAALLAVPGVVDAYVWSNRTPETVTKGTTNTIILGHSIFISVYGGSDQDVAEAIFKTYNPGANLNGETTYTVEDTDNYNKPYPQYEMQWTKAKPVKLYIKVDLSKASNPPSDVIASVKQRVLDVMSGNYQGTTPVGIGNTISTGKFYAPVIAVSPDYIDIQGIGVSIDGKSYNPSLTVGIDQFPTLDANDIEVNLV